MVRTFSVGERVSDVERCSLAKVINKKVDKYGVVWYHLRRFDHPHDMWWTDEIHIEPPYGKQHDPKLNHYWDHMVCES